MKPKIAIFTSRYGTTAKNIIECCKDGRIRAEVLFVATHESTTCDEVKGYPCLHSMKSEVLFPVARSLNVSLVVLAGWLKLLKIPEDFRRRVINIHPSLLPKYGGKGMYGIHVHEAVLKAGEDTTGCTVHWVDDEYDHGEIISQMREPVYENDTPKSLQDRVKYVERLLYPTVINQVLATQ